MNNTAYIQPRNVTFKIQEGLWYVACLVTETHKQIIIHKHFWYYIGTSIVLV